MKFSTFSLNGNQKTFGNHLKNWQKCEDVLKIHLQTILNQQRRFVRASSFVHSKKKMGTFNIQNPP